jgi:hypothetical protein
MGAIGALQVNEIWFDLSNSISEFVPLLDEAELNGRMLLGAARVIQREIGHKALPSDQPAAALSQLDYLK